jgi:hypothetical protein
MWLVDLLMKLLQAICLAGWTVDGRRWCCLYLHTKYHADMRAGRMWTKFMKFLPTVDMDGICVLWIYGRHYVKQYVTVDRTGVGRRWCCTYLHIKLHVEMRAGRIRTKYDKSFTDSRHGRYRRLRGQWIQHVKRYVLSDNTGNNRQWCSLYIHLK